MKLIISTELHRERRFTRRRRLSLLVCPTHSGNSPHSQVRQKFPQLNFLHRHQSYEVETVSSVRYGLTADCREFVRPHGANVRFRFASVEMLTNGLSNFDQINRRGHVTLHYYALCLIAPQNSPRAHFKLHYYILCITARLIGNSVRRRKCIAKPYSTGSRYSQRDGA